MMQKNHGYLNPRHMIEFVISKYKEDISWVNQIKNQKLQFMIKVTITHLILNYLILVEKHIHIFIIL